MSGRQSTTLPLVPRSPRTCPAQLPAVAYLSQLSTVSRPDQALHTATPRSFSSRDQNPFQPETRRAFSSVEHQTEEKLNKDRCGRA